LSEVDFELLDEEDEFDFIDVIEQAPSTNRSSYKSQLDCDSVPMSFYNNREEL
jgi:hypothetical protein